MSASRHPQAGRHFLHGSGDPPSDLRTAGGVGRGGSPGSLQFAQRQTRFAAPGAPAARPGSSGGNGGSVVGGGGAGTVGVIQPRPFDGEEVCKGEHVWVSVGLQEGMRHGVCGGGRGIREWSDGW